MKKFHRCHHGNLKRLDTVEVLGIVGDDMSGTRSECALEQQIILASRSSKSDETSSARSERSSFEASLSSSATLDMR